MQVSTLITKAAAVAVMKKVRIYNAEVDVNIQVANIYKRVCIS